MTSVSGSASLMLLEDRQAVAVRQLVVEQHEIDPFSVALDGVGRRLGLDDAIAFLLEPLGQRPANQLLVVDDEHVGVCMWGRILIPASFATQRPFRLRHINVAVDLLNDPSAPRTISHHAHQDADIRRPRHVQTSIANNPAASCATRQDTATRHRPSYSRAEHHRRRGLPTEPSVERSWSRCVTCAGVGQHRPSVRGSPSGAARIGRGQLRP